MNITIRGVEALTEAKQQAVGRELLLVLYANNIRVNGVHVSFHDDVKSEYTPKD